MRLAPAALRPLRCAVALHRQLTRAAAPLARRMASPANAAAPAEGAAAPVRGALIVLEGADRAGKSTQCARLVASLRASGVDAAGWRFPDRTSGCGQMIDAYLKSQSELDDAAVHLLFSANRWEKRCAPLCHKLGIRVRLGGFGLFAHAPRPRRALMEATLRAGTTLVVDRYAYSGVAFTAAKALPGLDLEWCKARGQLLLCRRLCTAPRADARLRAGAGPRAAGAGRGAAADAGAGGCGAARRVRRGALRAPRLPARGAA